MIEMSKYPALVTAEQADDIEQARSRLSQTRRPTVRAMEDILHLPFGALDKGLIRVIDYMGDDAAVVQAARVSYGRGTKKSSEDKALIAYLMRHQHGTPFEMGEIKFHVKLPIFVARQWIRHRTANVNEYSARYSVLDKEFYIPEPEHLAAQSKKNHQGRGEVLEGREAEYVLNLLKQDSETAYTHYEDMLNERNDAKIDPDRDGLARELARMNLSLNFYTQWYWKTDIRNLLGFLKLRADSHAQYEIRVYADIMVDIVKAWLPFTYAAFDEYMLNATLVSKTGMDVVRRMLAGEVVVQETSGLGKREWAELMETLGKSA